MKIYNELCAVVKSFYSIGSVFGRVAGRCLLCLQRAMVDPLLTALRIISIFFFSATEKRRRLISTLVNHLREVIFRREFGWI
jgi:hypothetical protein